MDINKLSYRPEIDALRAIAVIPVILFHAHLSFSAGYVGVDVFFVISGFLITSIIAYEMRNDRFSFKEFWVRRIKRILPMSLLVTMVSLIAGYILFTPKNFTNLAESAISHGFMLSNMYFWKGAGNYFAADTELLPLLHTWSLSIEEQFYFLFPFLLFLFCRPNKSLKKCAVIVIMVTVISFALNIIIVQRNITTAFYWLPFRGWEMLAGCTLALIIGNIKMSPKWANFLLLTSLLIIIIPMLTLPKGISFPGWWALLPVIGACLYIMSSLHIDGFMKRVVTHKSLVFIGKISYSLYLWHWPILVYQKFIFNETTLYHKVVCIALCFILSICSYYLVEQKLRRIQLPAIKWYAFGATGTAVVLLAGFFIYFQDGLKERFGSLLPEYELKDVGENIALQTGALKYKTLGVEKEKPDYALWGDSHGLMLAETLHLESQKLGLSGMAYLEGGNLPITGLWRFSASNSLSIIEKNKRKEELITESGCKTLILVGRWNAAINGLLPSEINPGKELSHTMVIDEFSKSNTPHESGQAIDRKFGEMLKRFNDKGIKVIVLAQVPTTSYSDTTKRFVTLRKFPKLNVDFKYDTSLKDYQERSKLARRVFSSYKSDLYTYITLDDLFYKETEKLSLYEDSTFYIDDNHLTYDGVKHYMSGVLTGVLGSISQEVKISD